MSRWRRRYHRRQARRRAGYLLIARLVSRIIDRQLGAIGRDTKIDSVRFGFRVPGELNVNIKATEMGRLNACAVKVHIESDPLAGGPFDNNTRAPRSDEWSTKKPDEILADIRGIVERLSVDRALLPEPVPAHSWTDLSPNVHEVTLMDIYKDDLRHVSRPRPPILVPPDVMDQINKKEKP